MHHTFIITANVRGSLAAGRHDLSGCTNKTCTQKHANAARRLSRSAQTHVCLLKGNFVCGCECLNVTQHFFLIVWNWDRFLPSAKKNQGESCAALLVLPVTLKCTHVHAGRHAVFKGDCSKDSGHIKRKTLMSFKSNCPPASCAETRRCAHTFQHTLFYSPRHCWWSQIRTQSATLALPGVWCSKHKRKKKTLFTPSLTIYKNNTHRLITLFDFDLFLKQI